MISAEAKGNIRYSSDRKEPPRILFDDVGLEDFEDLVHIVCGVDVQADGSGEIQRENSHDGLGINDVASGDEIKILIKFCEVVYKRFDLVDGVEGDRNSFHNQYPFLCENGAELVSVSIS